MATPHVDPLTAGNCGDDDELADNLCQHYVFPNIRSGPGIVAATIIDDETADLITIESGTDTVVQKCGNDLCTVPDPAGDTFQIRLTKRPAGARRRRSLGDAGRGERRDPDGRLG